MTLESTPSIVTPAGVAGLAFKDEADTVNQLIRILKRGGINAVVVLLHEGGLAPGSINGCVGISGPIVDIVKRLDDAVDAVVSGHTHQAYNCTLPNSKCRAIPVTSAGSFGRLLTSMDMTLSIPGRGTSWLSTRLINSWIATMCCVRPIQSSPWPRSAPLSPTTMVLRRRSPTASSAKSLPISPLFEMRLANCHLGDVIADSQLAATAPADKGGATIAFMNTGGIRANLTYAGSTAGEGDGNITYGEAFTVQPFGNSLTVKTLTGQQLYDLLNQQWAIGQSSDGGRTLQISGGLTYQHTFVPNVSPLGANYVRDGSLKLNGVPIDKSASYRVTMNSFLASGGDNYSVFNLGSNQLGGDVDLDALEAYFHANPDGVAPGPQNRIQQVAAGLDQQYQCDRNGRDTGV